MKAPRTILKSRLLTIGFTAFLLISGSALHLANGQTTDVSQLSDSDFELVESVEKQRVAAIERVIGSVIAIYGDDRQGGGSGVIIDASGIALTNHHVIMGAGVTGWGGLSDGNLYRWKLIGTDPGGDVSMIQMEGLDEFPFTPLGDSDRVRVGDWALAMGNPFILTEDQSPTVTLGIVSGVKRYQPGAGANQLVYGNCIQVDSSINPGNSGGPLFNLNGEVIGINGRGSFKERGRVNVGLGYAISSNQIRNFIPDLLATKLVEHATLDANFSDRDGKVICSQLDLDSRVAQSGLELRDELLEFEGTKIDNANQYTNLICTLPEDWPTRLVIRKPDGEVKTIVVRAFGLPYQKPQTPPGTPEEGRTPEEKRQLEQQRQMIELLSAEPGTVRIKALNQIYTRHILDHWQSENGPDNSDATNGVAKLTDQLVRDGQTVGTQTLQLASDGRFRLEITIEGKTELHVFDGESVASTRDGKTRLLSAVEAKINLPVVQAMAMAAALQEKPIPMFGDWSLDGSDKAVGVNAYRMKLLDSDSDVFYCWLRMYDDYGRPATGLVKASADKDCDDSGGVTFHDWTQIGPVQLPLRRDFVSGLTEVVKLSVVNESFDWTDEIDEFRFQITQQDQP